MKKIVITRSFLKRPNFAVYSLLVVFVIFEITYWQLVPGRKLDAVSKYEAGPEFLYIVIRGGILPELVTVSIVVALIDILHKVLKISAIEVSWRSLLRYELSFLPVMLLAFFVFNPITQSVRYLLVEFPGYDFAIYRDHFILGSYTWKSYFQYVFAVLLMGYFTLNSSLLRDFLKTNHDSVE
ncbi:hypothetical protein GCM10028803_28910 [Larkinella knui]|uniref:Uncharacterized protein n=1 Tax=Larkinella knui TaxID=2025310 RepID=A0A3P1CY62_9BACT|nr:hypothetical protein [Larkinella knui]RRB17926.1 hypothetical protein EHT87_06525 [Larkinella knui]